MLTLKGRRRFITGQWAEAGRTLIDESIREYLKGFEDIVSRILMAFGDAASEGLKKSRESVIENWRKGDTYYVVAESLATHNHLWSCGK